MTSLPIRPRCDRPDFKRVAVALAALGEITSSASRAPALRAEYASYCRTAAQPYAWRVFCQKVRLWEREQEAKRDAKLDREATEFISSENYWRGVAAPKARVILMTGDVATVSVRADSLRLWDGHGETFFAPGGRMPSAVVFEAFGGSVSLAAARFCLEHRVALIYLNGAGIVSFVAPAAKKQAEVIRAQVAADPCRVARAIVTQKIQHCRAAGRLSAAEARNFKARLNAAVTVTQIIKAEADAARLYWGRFEIALRPRKGSKLPPHWRGSSGRPSALGPGPSRATRPLNTMLNYAYAIALGRLSACLAGAGACLSVGFLHSDKPGRASLAYDAMEPLRPIIDARVAKWAEAHRFAPGDFIRLRSGEIRLAPSFAKAFGQETSLPKEDIALAAGFHPRADQTRRRERASRGTAEFKFAAARASDLRELTSRKNHFKLHAA